MGRLQQTIMLACLLSGCGGASAKTLQPPTYQGNPDAEPSLLALPETDIPWENLSAETQSGLELAEECFALTPPTIPENHSAENIERWSNETLRSWLQKKRHVAEIARTDLIAGAEHSLRERIIAGAVVGLLYEEIGVYLAQIPMPRELQSEPGVTADYAHIIAFQAEPFVAHARRAYKACAANAVEGPLFMEHFSSFCARRLDKLPPIR